MKKEHSKKLNKIVITVIAIIMLCSFAMPKKIQAVTTENGGSFQEPFAKFMCFIPDVVNNLLQHTFISLDDIKSTNESGESKYSILYSPGIIFSGTVPAFDINFINPGKDLSSTKEKDMLVTEFVELMDGSIEPLTIGIWEGCEVQLKPNCYADGTIPNFDEQFSLIGIPLNSSAITYYSGKTIGALFEDDIKLTEFVKQLIYANDNTTADTIMNDLEWNWIEVNPFISHGGAGINRNHDNAFSYGNTTINGKDYELFVYEYDVNNDILQMYSVYDGTESIVATYNYYSGKEINTGETLDDVALQQKIEDDLTEKILQGQEIDEDKVNIIKKEIRSNLDFKLSQSKTYKSSARILQPIVASWYKATRRIALVGLLSVLVYLGIRIVLSSTSAQDKAKYKKMLKNWVEAICLLFMLHFIMSLIIILVTQINSIVGTSAMAPNGEDVLLSKLRNEIYDAGEWAQVISQVVIYTVITVYSIIFTIQYFRRTIYMAFLTAIAPLITLTYPLDKIKDSKAQAFDMWLKDYIFFSLLQVLHLLIYYIFVSQAISLSEVGTKWSLVYSIVAIGFLTQAEKIMKKMFGFQKSQSLGALAAGATGALIMNLFNKGSLRRPPKAPQSAGNAGGGSIRTSGGRSGTRTQSSNPLETLQTSMNISSSQETPREQTNSGENVFEGDNEGTLPTPENNGPVSNTTPSSNSGSRSRRTTSHSGSSSQRRSTPSNETNNSSSSLQNSRPSNGKTEEELKAEEREQRRIARKRIRKGITALRKRYVGPALSRTGGIFLGGAGTLIGFSAGVAQGDIGKALTGAVAGGTAGYYGGQKLVNAGLDVLEAPKHIKDKVTEIEDTFNEGARGKEYVQNARFDRAFRESEDYRKLMEDNPKTPDEYIQKMLDAGITEKNRMDKILKKNKEDSDRYSIDRAIGYSALAKECPNSVLFNDKKFIKFCSDREIEITPEEAKAVRRVLIEFK